jgi:hypothetical protein
LQAGWGVVVVQEFVGSSIVRRENVSFIIFYYFFLVIGNAFSRQTSVQCANDNLEVNRCHLIHVQSGFCLE